MAKFAKGNPGKGRKPAGPVHRRTVFLNALEARSSSEAEFAQNIVEPAEGGNGIALTAASTRLWKTYRNTLPIFEGLPDIVEGCPWCINRIKGLPVPSAENSNDE